jgi:hypothetical protein
MNGTPVGRNWIVMMHNGVTAIDWGDGQFQDAVSGDFFNAVESNVSHRATNANLDWLLQIGRIDDYNDIYVYFIGLPDLPFRTIRKTL